MCPWAQGLTVMYVCTNVAYYANKICMISAGKHIDLSTLYKDK